MYAERRTGRFNPGSFAVAMGVNGLVIGALFYAAPGVIPTVFTPDPPLVTYPVDLPKPPREPQTLAEPSPAPRLRAPTPLVPVPTPDRGVTVDPTPYVPPTIDGSVGSGAGPIALPVDPPKPALMVQPGIDPRYAADFQPVYPAGERRAEREGRVVVRVLIGTDGRVKQIERVSATNDAFYRATLERAMGKWRFTPGTRDGVPVEAWRTMSLRFVLSES